MPPLFHAIKLGSPLALGAALLAACGGAEPADVAPLGSLQAPLLADVLRIESRTDGLFDVYCKDGRVERGITTEQIVKQDVCNSVTGGGGSSECYTSWHLPGASCPPPRITSVFISDADYPALFCVVGTGFQEKYQYVPDSRYFRRLGPYGLDPAMYGDEWNTFGPSHACRIITPYSYYFDIEMKVRNPDGQVSNLVKVQDRRRMVTEVPSSGSFDPFDPSACQGLGMTKAEATALISLGGTSATLGYVNIMKRERRCNITTGCQPWGAPTLAESNVKASIRLTGGGTKVSFSFGSTDCGVLQVINNPIAYNSCRTAGDPGGYSVHIAPH